jgi:hypothetical protein
MNHLSKHLICTGSAIAFFATPLNAQSPQGETLKFTIEQLATPPSAFKDSIEKLRALSLKIPKSADFESQSQLFLSAKMSAGDSAAFLMHQVPGVLVEAKKLIQEDCRVSTVDLAKCWDLAWSKRFGPSPSQKVIQDLTNNAHRKASDFVALEIAEYIRANDQVNGEAFYATITKKLGASNNFVTEQSIMVSLHEKLRTVIREQQSPTDRKKSLDHLGNLTYFVQVAGSDLFSQQTGGELTEERPKPGSH